MKLRRQEVSAIPWTSWVSVGLAGSYSSNELAAVVFVGSFVFRGEDGGSGRLSVAKMGTRSLGEVLLRWKIGE